MDTFTAPTHDLTDLLAAVSSASSLDQISTVIIRVRAWLADHPDDSHVRDLLENLLRMEHAHFS